MKRLVKAVAIITIFSVLTRAMGFVLRIYMSRQMGAELLGEYQVAITVFGVLCTLISSGIPIMISRFVSANSQNPQRQNQAVSSGFWIATAIAIVLSGIIFAFPQILASVFTSKGSTKTLLWLLPGVVASAVYASFRGALWGKKCYFWISFSEFLEQAIRIVFIVILFEGIALQMGKAELAAISLSAACVVSAIIVVILFFTQHGKIASPFPQLAPMLKSSSPITAMRTVSSLGTFVIAIIIPLRLVASGMTNTEAMSLFGIATGMSLPLLMIPSTLIGALATALVPEISEFVPNPKAIDQNPKLGIVKARINSGIKVSLVISFILVPVYLFLGEPIGSLLFASKEAGAYTARAAILMVPICLSQISSSMLNAIGWETKSLLHYVLGSLLMFASIYFLPPLIGINALIVGMAALFGTTTIMNFALLARHGLISNEHTKTALLLALYCIPSSLAAKYIYGILSHFTPSIVALGVAGLFSVAFFMMLTIMFKQFDISIVLSKRHTNKS